MWDVALFFSEHPTGTGRHVSQRYFLDNYSTTEPSLEMDLNQLMNWTLGQIYVWFVVHKLSMNFQAVVVGSWINTFPDRLSLLNHNAYPVSEQWGRAWRTCRGASRGRSPASLMSLARTGSIPNTPKPASISPECTSLGSPLGECYLDPMKPILTKFGRHVRKEPAGDNVWRIHMGDQVVKLGRRLKRGARVSHSLLLSTHTRW